MEKLGEYLGKFKDWVKEGWRFLFEDTNKIQSHHLLAFLLTIFMLHVISYLVKRIFATLVKLIILFILLSLAYMVIFDRAKFNQLFCHEDHSKKDTPPTPPDS